MRAVQTAGAGEVDGDTLFSFAQSGSTVSAHYAGGAVELDYGEVHGGRSVCEVTRHTDGRLRLLEHFHWESREGSGTNALEEVDDWLAGERGTRCM